MLGDVVLRHGGGHVVRPFYEVPWLRDGSAEPDGLLGHMRNEFACVPFGVPYAEDAVVDEWRPSLSAPVSGYDPELDASDDLLHGYGCVGDWTLVQQTSHAIEIALSYPETSAIERVVRRIAVDPASPTIDFTVTVEARRKTRRPIGLHPNLALPSVAGAFRIDPGEFEFGVVHPGGPEPGVSRGVPGAVFRALDEVPVRVGGTAAFDRLPFSHDTEEIIQLCGVDGRVVLTDEASRVAYRLSWDAAVLPSLLLWISNRGRQYSPWSGRNLCVGVEPVAAAFELGCRTSLANNPINARGIATAVELDPQRPLSIAYRLEMLSGQSIA
ncbi:hypothetical protein FAZ69_18515 [Trinickia terrae]|uniref:Aldose 1-epimerase n=2 Tax=Trinickia terrae TaxID=2571161 RepID=A0A4U1I2C4_9BURK|nr:hypothetical protein FAZ69_18515 [Trinickia terrae]